MTTSARNTKPMTIKDVKKGATKGELKRKASPRNALRGVIKDIDKNAARSDEFAGVNHIPHAEAEDALRKLDDILDAFGYRPERCRPKRTISARNALPGTIKEVKTGATTSIVRIDVGGGAIVTASITNESVDELDLKVGDKVHAVIKASDVMIAV